MPRLTVAAAVLNTTPLDWAGNRAAIVAALTTARRRGATLVCLPELCLTGYGCEDAFHSSAVQDAAWAGLHAVLPHTRGLVACLGLPLAWRGALFNTACLVADGRILGFTAKHFLAGDGIHYEPRWFKPWPVGVRTTLVRDGGEWPLGDLLFDVGGVRIGFEICEDAWVANRPGAQAARLGCDLLLNPSASHFAFAKSDVRRRFVTEGSRAFGVVYLYANLLGNESGRAIYDGGALIASGGALVAEGPRLGFADHVVTAATVDIGANRTARARTTSFQPVFDHEPAVVVPFAWPATIEAVAEVSDRPTPWETAPTRKEEEFARAEALGLFDYLRKSRSQGFALSLSGGHDSAAVAVLVALCVRLAHDQLGAAVLAARLAHIPGVATIADDVRALVHRLLITAYQGTSNSSSVTRDAARTVAAAVGAEHHEFEVDALVASYTALVEGALRRPLTWKDDDLALQNIQARVRAPGIWMLTNVRGALLLATSNRSEAAVGYATMDGDTAGGLSPIAGIDKAFLRHWLRWMQDSGPHGVGALPTLSAVTAQASTPELRPEAAAQVSEGDLMPFAVLDAIERAAIRDKQGPLEVLATLERAFPANARRELATWIERFFTLWCRNQWKRERYAPSFHLDDENLDPKTWCRFPILSGGFREELAALRAAVGDG